MVVLALGLTACTEAPREATRGDGLLAIAAPATTRAVARDVPAPDVFQVTETGLWDGRPSLGGIWVAHPAAVDPERVVIRNTATGAEVIGALFRRERENPGPRFQISSEAAAALGILAGQPATVEVTALRVEEARAAPAAPAAPAGEPVAAAPAAPDAAAPVETAAARDAPVADEAPAPRRTLRDLFRRREAAPEVPEAPVESAALPTAPVVAAAPAAPVVVAAAPPVPAGAPVDTVEITTLDAEPEAPRRTLFDLFRRREAAPEAPAIAQTALAPVAPVVAAAAPVAAQTAAAAPAVIGAPLVAVAFLSEGGEAAPPRPARFDEPGLIAPEAAAEASGWSLRDLFRRREAAPEAPAEATLIPVPAVEPAAAPIAATPVAPAAAAPAIERPFVQAAVFAVEANAARARAQMQAAGLPAEVRQSRAGERTVWRLVVGPATDAASQSELVRQTRALGFADAFAVRG